MEGCTGQQGRTTTCSRKGAPGESWHTSCHGRTRHRIHQDLHTKRVPSNGSNTTLAFSFTSAVPALCVCLGLWLQLMHVPNAVQSERMEQ